MAVSSGIIETALHPPVGLLFNHLDGNGPYGPGDHLLTTWLDGVTTRSVANTFGVLAIANGAIPSKFGVRLGCAMGGATIFTGDEYEPRLLQVVAQHQLSFGLGGWITTQIEDINTLAAMVLWTEALPGRIGLYVAPGMHFDLQFLLVF